jgi:hypothetical protein
MPPLDPSSTTDKSVSFGVNLNQARYDPTAVKDCGAPRVQDDDNTGINFGGFLRSELPNSLGAETTSDLVTVPDAAKLQLAGNCPNALRGDGLSSIAESSLTVGQQQHNLNLSSGQ